MRHTRLQLFILFLAPLVALGLASPAQASTQGTPDTENTYSNVGFLLFYSGGDRYSCSGTLVAPTLVLTAGHCTDGVDGRVLVSFDPVIDEEAPLKYQAAKDPAAGYTTREVTAMKAFAGTAYPHPQYSDFTDMDNWNDVGVVVLDKAIKGISPATVASLDTLGGIGTSNLSKTLFRAVGYGTEVRKADSGPQKPTPMSYPVLRRYVDTYGQKLTPQILQTNGSTTNGGDTGSTCFGDSGGPLLLDGEVVGVTSYGNNDVCRGVSGYQRVDIPVVQDWLASFGLKF